MSRRDAIWLAVLAAVFLACRVPLEYRTAAGQDEDWYGVTGITTLRRGVPSIPFASTLNPASVAYKSDVALYSLPPLNFYLQALVHVFLGEGLGPARLASTFAGLAAVGLVYTLARAWFEDGRVAVLSATAFIVSRAFLFPAITARPDMATAAFGLLAVWCVVRHRRDARDRWLIVGGAAVGLALLSHPYGLVPAIQCGLALLAEPGSIRRRLRTAALLTIIALAVFALWLPLIALHPDLFRAQFGANVLKRRRPGTREDGRRAAIGLVVSGRALRLVRSTTPSVCVRGGFGVDGGSRHAIAARARIPRDVPALAVLLLAVLQGRHPSTGYYVYPVGLLSIAVGRLAADLAAGCERFAETRHGWGRAAGTTLATCCLVAVFLPGAGLRNLYSHLRHANDPNYNAHLVTRSIMADIPTSALVAVDGAYILDFYLARRPVVELIIHPLVIDVREHPFEYAVLGPSSLTLYKSQIPDLDFIKSYGDKNDLFAPYAELYRRVNR